MKPAIPILVAAVLLIAVTGTIAACGTTRPASSAASPAAWPLAPAVTPAPGEPFVGYWQGDQTDMTAMESARLLEVLKGPHGYEVSRSGQRPYPVEMKHGRLIVQAFHTRPAAGGYWVTPGYALAWQRGRCVLYTKDSPGPFSGPPRRAPLRRLTRSAYLKAASAWAGLQTHEVLFGLYMGVSRWADMHGHIPPSAAQLHPGSAFDRWFANLVRPDSWDWPLNPFSDEPVKMGTAPGEFSYSTNGTSWTMTGYLSAAGTSGPRSHPPGASGRRLRLAASVPGPRQ